MKQMQSILEAKGQLRSAQSTTVALKPIATALGKMRLDGIDLKLGTCVELLDELYNDDASEAFADPGLEPSPVTKEEVISKLRKEEAEKNKAKE